MSQERDLEPQESSLRQNNAKNQKSESLKPRVLDFFRQIRAGFVWNWMVAEISKQKTSHVDGLSSAQIFKYRSSSSRDICPCSPPYQWVCKEPRLISFGSLRYHWFGMMTNPKLDYPLHRNVMVSGRPFENRFSGWNLDFFRSENVIFEACWHFEALEWSLESISGTFEWILGFKTLQNRFWSSEKNNFWNACAGP